MIAAAGASRMSSVRGLKARPHTATTLPASAAEMGGDARHQHPPLRLVGGVHRLHHVAGRAPASSAVLIRAFTSLGKHDPP